MHHFERDYLQTSSRAHSNCEPVNIVNQFFLWNIEELTGVVGLYGEKLPEKYMNVRPEESAPLFKLKLHCSPWCLSLSGPKVAAELSLLMAS